MDFYDVLETLIDKSDCGETQKRDMKSVISKLRSVNAFGTFAITETQDHICSPILETGKCVHCHKQMQLPQQSKPRYRY